MSFDKKIQEYFSNLNINLSSKPAGQLLHIYADYVEIVSLFSNQNFVSTADILDRFRDEGIISHKKNDDEQAPGNDENEKWVNEIFNVINDRVYLYEDDYPFSVTGNRKIKLKQAQILTNRHKIYIYLLLASSLNIFSIFEPELTSEFELLSYQSLKAFLPEHAFVAALGEKSHYTGTAKEKITALAKDLKLPTNDYELSKLSKQGNKERGLDLVGTIGFSDNVPNHFSLFCQCACGKEWYKKQLESRRYEHYYTFYRNKPNHAMFIPYSLINYQNSDFYQSDEITIDTLVFDRKRILNYITDSAFFNSFNSKVLVDNCITFEEDIV